MCCLFGTHTDKKALLKMFKQYNSFDQQSKLLNGPVIFLEDVVQCRHKRIMCYYGEERDSFLCHTSCSDCDNLSQIMGYQMCLKLFKHLIVELTGKEHEKKLYLAEKKARNVYNKMI